LHINPLYHCHLQVLLVNLVTSITLGLALAAEPAEPSVMSRPPRRPGKRLVGKLLLWRMFFVAHIIVVLVIGMFYWGGVSGLLLTQQRAEAFNVLVGAQVAYFICNRFIKACTFHPRVLHGNRVAYASVFITLGFMVSGGCWGCGDVGPDSQCNWEWSGVQ
jgi:magnesium-transporting ATPase (P-type)